MTPVTLCLCLLVQAPTAPLPTTASISEHTGGIRAGVLSGGGVPRAGVLVLLRRRDGAQWSTRTDARGHFQAGGLPPGEYLIEARLPGYRSESCPILIKAQAWLLGVPVQSTPRADGKTLSFQGPATYESGLSPIQPQKRPELGKIPMH